MDNKQWNELLEIIDGKVPSSPAMGLIIDSPWLPGWTGIRAMDYYSSDDAWFDANLKAIREFPEISFLPGFWSEYGEINEPSAFGCRLVWMEENLPHAEKILKSIGEAASLKKPDVESDGLLPLMTNRLKLNEPRINREGHQIRFAVARGPFNIASFMMGATEFMTAMIMGPAETHKLLQLVTDFLVDWIRYQKKCFPTIEGIMILDDLVGFVGEPECSEYAVPCLKQIYRSFDSEVNFFHNDADGLVIGAHHEEIGVNLYNFSFKHSMQDMREACGGRVVLLGNIPPRDVMAVGGPPEVRRAVENSMGNLKEHKRVIWSFGGGVSQGVPTENIRTFIESVRSFGK